MTILVDRIEQTPPNCVIWMGRVSKADALALPARIDPALPMFGCQWISYFDSNADMSELDAACLLELRDRLRPVVSGLAAKGVFRTVLVSNSRYYDPLLTVWRSMTALDADYPSEPVIQRDIPTAARALGLSDADAEQARLWIERRLAEVSRGTTG